VVLRSAMGMGQGGQTAASAVLPRLQPAQPTSANPCQKRAHHFHDGSVFTKVILELICVVGRGADLAAQQPNSLRVSVPTPPPPPGPQRPYPRPSPTTVHQGRFSCASATKQVKYRVLQSSGFARQNRRCLQLLVCSPRRARSSIWRLCFD